MKQITYGPAVKSLKKQAEKVSERVEFYSKKEQENKLFKEQMQQQLDFLNAQIERLSSPILDLKIQEPQNHNVISEHELETK